MKIRVESEVLYLPQLKEMIGRDVVITVEDPWRAPELPPLSQADRPHPGMRLMHRHDEEFAWDIGGEGGE